MGKTIDTSSISSNKPLICLYKFAELVKEYDNKETSLDLTMKGLIEMLPQALRYPKLAGVRILIPPFAYETKEYVSTTWSMKSDLKSFDEIVGHFEISYTRDVKKDFYDCYTADETILFTYIATRINRIIERFRIKKQLQLESRSLKDANTTLNEVLRRKQSEQSEVGKLIQTNINKVVIPMLNSINLTLNEQQQKTLHVIINNLHDIASPFASKLSSEFMSLTPQELIICNLIKEGFSSKDIAHAKGLSIATVNNHREHIRKKLNLDNKKINLRSYLANNFDSAIIQQ
jgi:DNA-binding CsgD family transcriptional regulator